MANVGIVLSGGVESDGSLPPYAKDRVKALIASSTKLDFIIFSSRYTLNKPQIIDASGFVVHEAKVMADYFAKHCLFPKSKQYLELASTDTVGSALFSRLLIESIGVSAGFVTVFTSDWHIVRSLVIFRWAFALENQSRQSSFNVRGLSTRDKQPSKNRSLKEKHSLEQFKLE